MDVDLTAPVINLLDTGDGIVSINDPQHCPTFRNGKEFLLAWQSGGGCRCRMVASTNLSGFNFEVD
ncbi:MAG: hypothetical protein O3B13_14285 [Planctomycetota bacterium]|nr:hypothetical protein [Planctomycetota bacterium]